MRPAGAHPDLRTEPGRHGRGRLPRPKATTARNHRRPSQRQTCPQAEDPGPDTIRLEKILRISRATGTPADRSTGNPRTQLAQTLGDGLRMATTVGSPARQLIRNERKSGTPGPRSKGRMRRPASCNPRHTQRPIGTISPAAAETWTVPRCRLYEYFEDKSLSCGLTMILNQFRFLVTSLGLSCAQ